jgi:hypothetical protein
MRRFVSFLIAAAFLTASAESGAFTVTLIEYTPGGGDPQNTYLLSQVVKVEQQDLVFEPVSLPFIDSHRATSHGTVSETGYALSSSALDITIVEHSHSHLGGASTSRGAVYFIVDRDVEYLIAGEYSLQSTASQEMQLIATLVDLDTGELLFDSYQWGTDWSETFILGEERGNRENRLSGALAGTLSAGTPYRWTYTASSWGAGAGHSANASGFITVRFIPEPSTALLFLRRAFAFVGCVILPRNNGGGCIMGHPGEG